MIKTKNGTVEFEGTRPEIYGDLFAILEAALLKTPMELYLALETFGRDDNNLFKDEIEKEKRSKVFTAILAAMPEEEREQLKKQMEGKT